MIGNSCCVVCGFLWWIYVCGTSFILLSKYLLPSMCAFSFGLRGDRFRHKSTYQALLSQMVVVARDVHLKRYTPPPPNAYPPF